MEIIYPVLFFIVPGMIVKTIYNTLEKPKRQNKHFYEYLAEIVIDSFIVIILSAIAYETFTLDDLIIKLNNIEFLGNFVAFIILMSVIWYAIKYTFVIKVIYWCINRIKISSNFIYGDGRTVWEKILGDQELMGSWLVVSIFRDEKYITTGMIDCMNCAESDEFEFRLSHTQKCRELLKHDRKAFVIIDEFYNVNQNLRILFYDDEKIQEHWHKYFNE